MNVASLPFPGIRADWNKYGNCIIHVLTGGSVLSRILQKKRRVDVTSAVARESWQVGEAGSAYTNTGFWSGRLLNGFEIPAWHG